MMKFVLSILLIASITAVKVINLPELGEIEIQSEPVACQSDEDCDPITEFCSIPLLKGEDSEDVYEDSGGVCKPIPDEPVVHDGTGQDFNDDDDDDTKDDNDGVDPDFQHFVHTMMARSDISCTSHADCGSHGQCEFDNKANETQGVCFCTDGYVSHEGGACNYPQKDQGLVLLAAIIGGVGIMRCCLGYWLLGVLKALSCIVCQGTCGAAKSSGHSVVVVLAVLFGLGSAFWYFYDWYLIISNTLPDSNGVPLRPW